MEHGNLTEKSGVLLRGLLALVKDVGGRVDGRVRIQKSAFLLKNLGVSDFDSARFRYHYYGPYSRELSNELHNAVLDGFLEENATPNPDDPKSYSYDLTDNGRAWLASASTEAQCSTLLGINKDKSDIIINQDSKKLELAATIVYLQQQDDSTMNDPRKALEKALELKPHCIPAKGDILQTLRDLGLIFSS